MHNVTKLTLLSGAAIMLAGTTIAISAQFVTAALGGPSSVKHHQEAYLAQLTEVNAALEERSRLTDQQMNRGNQVSSQIRNLIACEIRNGCVSGRGGGTGSTSRALQTVLSAFGSQQNGASSQANLQRALLDEARLQTEEARRASREGDAEGFNDHIALAHTALSRARGAAQKNVIDLSVLTNSSFSSVSQLANGFDTPGLQGRSEVLSRPVPVFEPMGHYEAVMAYSDKVQMAHVLGVSVELLPLIMFFVIMLSAQIKGDDDEDHPAGDDWGDKFENTYSFGNQQPMAAE